MHFIPALLAIGSAAFCSACGKPMGEGEEQHHSEKRFTSDSAEPFVGPVVDPEEGVDVLFDSDLPSVRHQPGVELVTQGEQMERVKVHLSTAQHRADDLLQRLRVIEQQLDEEEAVAERAE